MTLHENTTSRQQNIVNMSPSELLINLRRRYPHKTRDELAARFINSILDNESCNIVVIREWFSLNFNRLTRTELTSKQKAELEIKAAELKEKIKETIKKNMVKIVLLDLMQPNGKLLRDCTGKECKAFGGWYVELAKRCGNQLIGNVLSESQVKAIAIK